jgi:oligogalacturonide lyase
VKTLLLCSALATGALLARAADTPPAAAPTAPAPASSAPSEWIDPATGHRIVRLSQEPGSASLYFHQNAYTPQGDKLIISTPGGLSTVNLKTREVELVVPGIKYGMGTSATIEVGRKTRTVYYQRNEGGQTVIYATDVDTKSTRQIAKLGFTGEFGGVSADETLIFGKCPVPAGAAPAAGATPAPAPPADTPAAATDGAAPARGRRGGRGGGAGRMQQFFTVDIKSGAVKTFFPSTDNLNHDQCSPTDPNLVLFCHEGDWNTVDRIWTIHTDGTGAKLMHPRTMPYEIAGHEFFGHDGQFVWYDLQTPRSSVFWLAGVNVYTGERIRYPLERSQWSVHYNVSWNGKLFAGDGGGPNSVANHSAFPENRLLSPPQNGQWMYLFTPQPDAVTTMKVGGEDVKVGKFDVEKLVDLSKQNYTLEPNLTFTPDDKWLVFRSNMEGATQVYAVEIAKAK